MGLKKNLISLFSFSMLDRLFSGILQVIIFTVVIRNLGVADVGMLGIFGGLLVFFNLLAVSPEAILIRDFPKLKEHLGIEVGSYLLFGIFRTLLFIILSMIPALIYLPIHGIKTLIFPLWVAAFSIKLLGNVPREGLYVSFKQNLNFFLNLTFSLRQFFFYLFLLPLYSNLLFYTLSLIGFNILSTTALYMIFVKKNDIKLSFKINWPAFFRNNFADFTLWNHLSGAITFMMYRIDTFILSLFVSIEAIASYTVALTLSNYFFVIPQMGEKVLKIGYSNLAKDSPEEKRFFFWGTLSLNILSLLQLAFFILFGKEMIAFLFPKVDIPLVYEISALIIIGVTLLNFVRPVSAILTIRNNLKKLFLFCYLPAGIFSLLVYFYLGYRYGTLRAVATGNIISYGAFAVLIALQKAGKRKTDV